MRTGPVLVALLLVGALSGCLSGNQLVGKPAPAFALTTSEGLRINETSYLGKWLVLDLMATWCGPCKLEVEHLREVQRIHGDNVAILSVGTDPSETLQDLERFGEEYGATWPYAIDREGKMRETMRMRIIPKLVIVAPDGTVAFESEGEVLPAAINGVIDPSLREPLQVPIAAALAGAALGFLGAYNPYRRLHRDAPGPFASLLALAILGGAAILAWPFAEIVSTRATYGSLLIGAIALAAAAWWFRARVKAAPPEGTVAGATSDRAYELAPHFVGAVVIGLTSAGAIGFFAPVGGVIAGAAAGLATRERIPERYHVALGLAGLVAAGAWLVWFGARVFAL